MKQQSRCRSRSSFGATIFLVSLALLLNAMETNETPQNLGNQIAGNRQPEAGVVNPVGGHPGIKCSAATPLVQSMTRQNPNEEKLKSAAARTPDAVSPDAVSPDVINEVLSIVGVPDSDEKLKTNVSALFRDEGIQGIINTLKTLKVANDPRVQSTIEKLQFMEKADVSPGGPSGGSRPDYFPEWRANDSPHTTSVQEAARKVLSSSRNKKPTTGSEAAGVKVPSTNCKKLIAGTTSFKQPPRDNDKPGDVTDPELQRILERRRHNAEADG